MSCGIKWFVSIRHQSFVATEQELSGLTAAEVDEDPV